MRSQPFRSFLRAFCSSFAAERPGRINGTEQEIPSVRKKGCSFAPFRPLRKRVAAGKWDQKIRVCSASSSP